MKTPKRGEIWWVELSPTRGHEQSGRRPGLILSDDLFNAGPAELVVVLPMTTRDKRIPSHVAVEPSEPRLKVRRFIKCEEPRTIAKERLGSRMGAVKQETMAEVERRVRWLLGL